MKRHLKELNKRSLIGDIYLYNNKANHLIKTNKQQIVNLINMFNRSNNRILYLKDRTNYIYNRISIINKTNIINTLIRFKDNLRRYPMLKFQDNK